MEHKPISCVCGGQPVIYENSGIVIIKCSECGQFVSNYGSKEQAIEEWRMRMYEEQGKRV
mgnify:CR=1 FL=1